MKKLSVILIAAVFGAATADAQLTLRFGGDHEKAKAGLDSYGALSFPVE